MELKIKGKYLLNSNSIGNETSLKQVFDENINNYWTKVFKGHSPKEPPSYRYLINLKFQCFQEANDNRINILLRLPIEKYLFPIN